MKYIIAIALLAFSANAIADSGNELPVGGVIGYIGDPASLGSSWCLCDGRSLAIEDNLVLFKRIGWLYGLGSEGKKMTTFNLPDLRGQFLRGVDAGSGRDPSASLRSLALNGTVPIGDRPGTFEGYATAIPHEKFRTAVDGGHSHAVDAFNRLLAHTGRDTVKERTDDTDSSGSEPALHNSVPMARGEHSHAVDSGGDVETRPANVSLFWLIRIK